MSRVRHGATGGSPRLLLGLLAALALVVGALLLAAFHPRLALLLPGAPAILEMTAGLLPRQVAWANDRGSERLRAGVYFGWTDGERGELHLYGEGCASEYGHDAPTYLALRGPAGTIEVAPERVTQLWEELDRGRPHPYLRVELAAAETLAFDAAQLRCRDGAEASARITATLLHLTPPRDPHPLAPPPDQEAPRPLTSLGIAAFPGVGQIGEATLASGSATTAVTLAAVDYAPTHAATSHLRAAAGSPAQAALWRALVRPSVNPSAHLLDPASLTPWDAAYQAPDDPRHLASRHAAALDLTLGPSEVAMLFFEGASFRRTTNRLPILVQPVVRYEVGGEEVALLPLGGLAFGWTETP